MRRGRRYNVGLHLIFRIDEGLPIHAEQLAEGERADVDGHECGLHTGQATCVQCRVEIWLQVANTEADPEAPPITVSSTDLTFRWTRSYEQEPVLVNTPELAEEFGFEVAHYSHRKDQELAKNDDGIVIVKLAPGQAIVARCWATMGVGKIHARFNPCATVAMRHDPDIRLNLELLERLPDWLESHRPEACLVHGDLWSGNIGLCGDGPGTLFDPSVHRGDREVELAMARLFGGVPESFFSGYEQVWPLPAGHQQRRPLYNLYHLLNHANLFGAGYRQQAQRQIQSLLQQRP